MNAARNDHAILLTFLENLFLTSHIKYSEKLGILLVKTFSFGDRKLFSEEF